MLAHTENRRSASRVKSFAKSTYTDSNGRVHETQIINSSQEGARLTTTLDVRVGDQLFIRQALFTGAVIEVPVEVQWTETVGHCQIAGVKTMEALPRLVSGVSWK